MGQWKAEKDGTVEGREDGTVEGREDGTVEGRGDGTVQGREVGLGQWKAAIKQGIGIKTHDKLRDFMSNFIYEILIKKRGKLSKSKH